MSKKPSMKDRLMGELHQALRAGDKQLKLTIRMLQAAIINEEKAGESPRELTEEEIQAIIVRQVKQRRESIAAYQKGNRQDLVEEEQVQLDILLEYLPRQMTREEIVATAQQAMAEVGATGPQDIGKVMRHLMPSLKGKADGRSVNQVVRELLAPTSQE
jgi:uncharacterized protein YqeY